MRRTYYTIRQIPDLTLSQYTTMDGGDVSGVITAHSHFWRQLNRKGLLNNEVYRLFYEYNPARSKGDRMRIGLAIDSQSDDTAYTAQIMSASALGPFYKLQAFDPAQGDADRGIDLTHRYTYGAHLYKAERFLSSKEYGGTPFYITSEWQMNDAGRLYTMMKLMAQINKPCLYVISIFPSELTGSLTESLNKTMYELRDMVKPQVSKNAGGASVNSKDEHAKVALDYYEDLLDSLAQNPHFMVDVQVMSDDPQHASVILDAAASEALSAGNHQIKLYRQQLSFMELNESSFYPCSDPRAPQTLIRLPQIMVLDEMTHFAVFPALYAGEWTEIPKETAPSVDQNGLLLGTDEMGHDVFFPVKNLSKHAFLAGVPGSGKTNSMMHLINEMHGRYRIPVLIFEPAKHEYRALTCVEGLQDISLFSPSACTHFPLHINPFEFPIGMSLAEHIRNLIAVFDGAFSLEPPMPFLLDASIQQVYEDALWHPSMINTGKLSYPTMSKLYKKLEERLEKTDYGPEIKGNLKSALQVRIGSLITREMADIFDVSESTFKPEDWMEKSAIIELESLGKDPANFTTLLIATLVRETLKTINYIKPPDGRPRHVMFFEEAHNLIGPTAVPTPGQADPKTAATAYIVKMLAEVRALGEGIVIADQLPTAMAPQVIKNTSLKIGLRITAQDDRELLGGTMSANPNQIEKWSIFNPGHGLISYEALLKPFEAQLPYFVAKEGDLADGTVLQSIGRGPHYIRNMLRSLDITIARWNAEKEIITKSFGIKKKLMTDIRSKLPENFEIEKDDPKYKAKMELVKLYDETKQLVDDMKKQAMNLSLKAQSYLSAVGFMREEAFYASSPEREQFLSFVAKLNGAMAHIEDPLNEILAFQNELRSLKGLRPIRARGFYQKKKLFEIATRHWADMQ